MDFETKYIGHNIKAATIKSWLEANFPADPLYPETIISSIYFDTFKFKHLAEKQESDHIKSKFRIRWYEDIQTKAPSEVCFLEFKHKIGENRHKKRIKMQNTFWDLELASPDFYAILNELRLYEGKVLDKIFPSYTVSYTRKRFIIPDTEIRLCIDYNINVPKFNPQLIKCAKQSYLQNCVFELKGPTAVLPPRLRALEQFGVKKDAFSKYERCFEELLRV